MHVKLSIFSFVLETSLSMFLWFYLLYLSSHPFFYLFNNTPKFSIWVILIKILLTSKKKIHKCVNIFLMEIIFNLYDKLL